MTSSTPVRAASEAEVRRAGCTVVSVAGHAIALFAHNGHIYAVDNRCPHMGFPLHRGTVQDGILTCHWHHARFDLATGGTFDPWADDVRSFPVEIRDGEVWVDLAAPDDARAHHARRLEDGLQRAIPLVLAKAAIVLAGPDGDPVAAFRAGLAFGTRYRRDGWGPGLTIHTCMVNLIPALDPEDVPLALYHGLSAVAANTDGGAPRFPLAPLPAAAADAATLARWFRRFVEVRDADGAERALVTAVRAGAPPAVLAGMLFSASTDHRYVEGGHVLDFVNKACEALDAAGWAHADLVLTSLVPGLAAAERMEESNQWRHPVDLVGLLEEAFERLPAAFEEGRGAPGHAAGSLRPILLGDDPRAIVEALLDALRAGAAPGALAAEVAAAAAARIAQFPTSNEFGDWDTALHTFTFASAVCEGLRRAPSVELLRAVFDAAATVYLDRFLNVPPVRLPGPGDFPPLTPVDANHLLAELARLLDRQQQVDEAGWLVAAYLYGGGAPARLLATLGRLLLREDRNFHTIQMVEAAQRRFLRALERDPAGDPTPLIAAARYLAAHAPTMRAQGQTYRIAQRLHRGERLFEEVRPGP